MDEDFVSENIEVECIRCGAPVQPDCKCEMCGKHDFTFLKKR